MNYGCVLYGHLAHISWNQLKPGVSRSELDDVADEAVYQSRVRKLLMRLGHRSLLAVPLLVLGLHLPLAEAAPIGLIAVALAGRAAELQEYGEASSGISSDLAVATNIASQLVGQLGCWTYFQSIKSPENKKFLADWNAWLKTTKAEGVKKEGRVTCSPMVLSYNGVYLWKAAVEKAAARVAIASSDFMISPQGERRGNCVPS